MKSGRFYRPICLIASELVSGEEIEGEEPEFCFSEVARKRKSFVMKSGLLVLVSFLAVFLNFRSAAQDIQDSSDHPLFSRIPGFSIHDYMVEEPGIYTFYADQDSLITLEGKKTTIHYVCNCLESPLKIIRSFSNASRQNGGKSVEFGDNRIYIHQRKKGLECWAEIYAGEHDYFLTVIEYKTDN